MLGLRRDTVQLVEHHSEWSCMAGSRCQFLRSICREFVVDIQHIGSTSIPGLPAKPVLDIGVGVSDLVVIDDLRERLEPAGYIYRGVGSGSSGHVFVRESAPHVRIEHLHVNLIGGPHWNSLIAFRDIMRESALFREEYVALKRDLEHRFADDRKAYTQGKGDFIRRILREATDQKGQGEDS
jgi:GrpB-like predicted nucleotidyltransferase (UPF0157 family)